MRHISACSPTLAALFGILLASGAFARTNETIVGKVVGVHDGDTLTLLTAAKVQVKVRLNGIDAPEAGQAFGEKTKQALSAMVFSRTVRIAVTDMDRYGRTVGDVYVGDQLVNQRLVAGRWAWHYKQFSKSKELADAEAEARKKRLGLWAERNAVPPWEFRKVEREK